MKYAKRMVLVPEEDYLGFKNKRAKKQSDYLAAKALSQKLGKDIRKRDQSAARLHFQWQNLKNPPAPMVHLSSLYKESKPKSNILDLVQHLPPVNQPKGRLFLGELDSKGFMWTDDNAVVLPNGRTIPQSNIVDLMKEALVTSRKTASRRRPKGWQEFIHSVATVGVPASLFNKQSTLRDLSNTVQPTSPLLPPTLPMVYEEY